MKTILIVEDNLMIVKMISRRLKKAGYEILSAMNGVDGVEQALEKTPDLILMDMHMPKMDGYTAVQKLRDNNYTGLISALTASASIGDESKSITAGCDYFISKPIDISFEKKIENIIKGKQPDENPDC